MNPQQRPDDPIKHVVLLMFENHSFDQMLGSFKQVYPGLEGVDPVKPGVNKGDTGAPFKQLPTEERQMKDLAERGLLETTLVVVTGDMGQAPTLVEQGAPNLSSSSEGALRISSRPVCMASYVASDSQ